MNTLNELAAISVQVIDGLEGLLKLRPALAGDESPYLESLHDAIYAMLEVLEYTFLNLATLQDVTGDAQPNLGDEPITGEEAISVLPEFLVVCRDHLFRKLANKSFECPFGLIQSRITTIRCHIDEFRSGR